MVNALHDGTLTAAEIYERYLLTEEELADWEDAFERAGIAGLHLKSRYRRRAPPVG